MDHQRSGSGNGEENVGIPDDLRCKRSDGKQWRCTALSMPDKTVCEKHYIQAKKRAANSAMRASLKKAKRKSMGEEADLYTESKSEDFEPPLADRVVDEYPTPVSAKKRSFNLRNPPKAIDPSEYEEADWRSHRTSPVSGMNMSHRSSDANNPLTPSEYSDQSTESCEETESGGQTCHQCRRNDRENVIWCLKCDRRGYCDGCISSWYPSISEQEFQRICPACRGTCNCKVCLRGDNLLKVRIKEIPALDKLSYLHCLLSSVLPITKQIHQNQCFEVELEKKLRGTEIDLTRTRLNADEQMCCNFCRIPIIDYHRHCAHCSYDLCISCCRDLREASVKFGGESHGDETMVEQPRVPGFKLNFLDKFSEWKANCDGSIPCPPKEYGGCGYSSLNLSRIFKMNWVAKLVKNVEEMVTGCSICEDGSVENSDPERHQYSKEVGNERFLYCPTSEYFRSGGIGDFRKHWVRGEPVIVQNVFDSSFVSSWNPMEIWGGIRETTNEKLKDGNEIVKAIDCFDCSEVDVELGEFMKGYFEGRLHESGQPEMMKLKNWPSPSASEEFLLYQRPEFISKLPLLEFIHSKWGLLNVAAKLPHYSLQNDVGPKILISYGTHEELAMGNSVTNLHANIRDMVYLLVHTCEPKLYCQERVNISKDSNAKDSERDTKLPLDGVGTPELSLGNNSSEKEYGRSLDETMVDKVVENTASAQIDALSWEQQSNPDDSNLADKTRPGIMWDVFRRQDVFKLVEYLRVHHDDFGLITGSYDPVTRPLYDGRIFLNGHHKRKLKEEYGIEPWSFEQHLGQAVFVPAGCPFQVRNLQSTVQLGLDFLSPESLGEAAKMAEEIRCLPNDHEAKLQVLEAGKISLYAASSAIKEVRKLVLDPKLGSELGFEDRNLTAPVTENLKKMTKQRQIPCT